MKRARILTPWTGDGQSTTTAYRPLVSDRYPLARCVDVTGQPAENLQPDPNLFVVEAVCEEATLALIEADPDFVVLEEEDE
jgi:hypothetical protein